LPCPFLPGEAEAFFPGYARRPPGIFILILEHFHFR
jgi:hypothetical protein